MKKRIEAKIFTIINTEFGDQIEENEEEEEEDECEGRRRREGRRRFALSKIEIIIF